MGKQFLASCVCENILLSFQSILETCIGDIMLTHKICKICDKDLDVDQFHWKSKRKGTRQARCKTCASDYGHTHYIANSQVYKDRANSRLKTLRAENREFVKTHLSLHPCSKCGEANTKSLAINVNSTDINNLATSELLARLESSVVLCRNCVAAQE